VTTDPWPVLHTLLTGPMGTARPQPLPLLTLTLHLGPNGPRPSATFPGHGVDHQRGDGATLGLPWPLAPTGATTTGAQWTGPAPPCLPWPPMVTGPGLPVTPPPPPRRPAPVPRAPFSGPGEETGDYHLYPPYIKCSGRGFFQNFNPENPYPS
jgi:hypothetical protein